MHFLKGTEVEDKNKQEERDFIQDDYKDYTIIYDYKSFFFFYK